MDALKAVGLCALLAAPPQGVPPCNPVMQVSSPAIDRWQPLIEAASARFGISTDWIRAVMARESGGFTTWNGKPITSAKGAMGLMQLMPGTWVDIRARLHLGNDPYDPHDNIVAGTVYLRDMADRFGTGAFAAYNAGPGRYAAYLDGRATLPEETRAYVDRLTSTAPTPEAGSAHDALFIVNIVPTAAASQTSSRAVDASHDLFVPLSRSAP